MSINVYVPCWRLSGIQALIALAFLGLLFALRRQFAKS